MKPSQRTRVISLLLILASAFNISASPANTTPVMIFAVIGDYGWASQPAADVARLVKSWKPGFIVTTGDNNYPNGAAYSIDKNIGQYYHNYIYKYRGKYGAGSLTRRFFPALGNHDWHQGSAQAYTNYFNLPGNERFYSFRKGPIQFFILDSMKEEPYGNTPESAQAAWLKNGLLASTAPFQIVVTHYPPYSSGKHGSVPFMQWDYKEWGADAVLSGHNHVYERLMVNDLLYLVNGLGGSEVGYFRAEVLPESRFRYNEDFGAMRVEAANEYVKFQFYSRNQILIDEYVIGQLPPSYPAVQLIQRMDSSPTFLSTLTYRVLFSQSVLGVDLSDFSLAADGVEGAFISEVTGAGAEYVVKVNRGTNTGSIRLDLIDDNSIANEAGETLGGENIHDGDFTGETYIISPSTPTPPATFTPIPTSTSIVAAPVLLSPANNSTRSADFIFTWSKISNATRYQILIDNNASFSSPEWNVLRQETSYQVSSLTRKTTHYWKVRAKDINGNWSEWSGTFALIVP